ncbi:hypothetical protein GC197_08835 [bacterium]|nr:hypothetical protein [bacterium]
MIGIEAFRGVQGDRLIMEHGQGGPQPTGVQKAELKFGDKVVHFFRSGESYHGTAQQITENREFKAEFMMALIKSEGVEVATRACRKAGLPENWIGSSKPMSGKQVKKVLNAAAQLRANRLNNAYHNTKVFMKGYQPVSFESAFTQHNNGRLPADDFNNPQLRRMFIREVKRDPAYGKTEMTPQKLTQIAQRAIDNFVAQKQSNFREQHPGLAEFVATGPGGNLHEDQRVFFDNLREALDPNHDNAHQVLSQETETLRESATEALDTIESCQTLLAKMEYSPEGWAALKNEINDKLQELFEREASLGFADLVMGDEDFDPEVVDPNGLFGVPRSVQGDAMRTGLINDLRHQTRLLQSKLAFIEDVAQNDPLSEKTVAYSNLLWAQAAGKIFDEAALQLSEQLNEHLMAGDMQQAERVRTKIGQLMNAKQALIDTRTLEYDNASTEVRTDLPGTIGKDRHPTTLGKTHARNILKANLEAVGFDEKTIKSLTNSKSLGNARRRALNENQTWAPYERNMVVTKDGVTRIYKSRITPGGSISNRFARRYAQSGVEGISSATKSDRHHARNLKVSELVIDTPDGEVTKAKVIGHGVLDMWDVPDDGDRQTANREGAHEVLEAAIVTNDRIRTTALNRAQTAQETGNPQPPVKITHVSVNLVTPAGWRELPGFHKTDKLHDYQEKTYTESQFDAFQANSTEGNGGSVQFQIDDDREDGVGINPLGEDVDIEVDVDVIAFSFAINPMATGKVPDFVGGWAGIYDHNKEMMVKFVGDLGEGGVGAFTTRPGGFIGSVMDRLDPEDPDQAKLLTRMQEQANIVRDMFTSEAFKRGNGDPAKMGRHILALQTMAEEVFELLEVEDEAATASKGCKSDKDRGGVTDVELKHQIITEDMGGEILPDQTLEGDDQANYYVVASSSGQLENQSFNTGLPGSKEAGKLGTRIPDRTVRQYLSGLGSFASE